MEQNEAELIARIMDGDDAVYEQIINRYKQGLYRHCFKFTHDEDEAEDIAHDACTPRRPCFLNDYCHKLLQ